VEQLVASPPKLSAARRELLRLLLEPGSPPAAAESDPPLVRLPDGAERPLSLAQERIWLSTRLAGDSRGGTTTAVTRLSGPLNLTAFEAAVGELVRRHEILRTSFPGELAPRAVVHPFAPLDVPRIDLAALSPAEQQAAIRRLVAAEANEPFLLDRLPLLRVKLVRLADREHLLVTSVHHIIIDGWSAGILNAELAQLYAAFTAGRPSPLAEPALQYADFAAWQRRWAGGPRIKRQLAYWKEQLAGHIPPVELPADRPRSARTFAGASYAFELPDELSRAILALARDAGATPFITLLSAFATLVQRLTGQGEMAFGSPVANRSRRELESVVGCFMHPLVLRLRLAGEMTFRELLARVREVCLAAYAHQDVPFELVMREIRPHWDAVHTPLFQILFNVQKAEAGRLALDGLAAGPAELHAPVSALDLSVHLWIGEGRIRGDLDYASDLFDEATIRWLVRGYQSLLESIVADPDRRLWAIPATGRVKSRPLPAAMLAPGLSPERRELLAHLLGCERDDLDLAQVVTRPAGERPLPCSFGQERLWLVEQMQPGQALFNQTQALELHGPLDVAALCRAIDEIIRRHEILRTGVATTPSGPVQVAHSAAHLALPLVDLAGIAPADQDIEFRRLLGEIATRPFQLDQPPLARAVLIRLGGERHLLGLTVHHLISDGFSTRVFRRELAAFYSAFAAGQPSPLADLPLQYADFARWQRRYVREAMLRGELAYWKDRLAGELPRIELPVDRPRSAALTISRNVALPFALPDTLAADLARLQREEGATPFMVLLAALFALFHRYSGQDDILVDTPTSGRGQRELEGLIGFFVNSLALRVDLSDRPTFRELIARVRAACLGAFANQDLPFDQVVSRLNLARDRRGQPLAPVSFMLHETVVKHEDLGAGVTIVPGPYDISDEFDLTLVVWQSPNGQFSGDLQYDPRLFTAQTAGRIAAHYQTLLAGLLANADRPVSDLPLLPREEQTLVLDAWSRGAPAAEPRVCIHELFEAQVRATPDAVAVVAPDSESSLTYDQLNRRANQLARHLRSLGVGAEHRVGICLDRSPDLVVAVWAVLKAGAAFVPLDAAYASQRLADMIRDARVTLLITHSGLLDERLAAGTPTLLLDREHDHLAAHDSGNLDLSIDDRQLAYVVYTSGSTGKPKGVMVSHRSLVNAYRGWEASYRLREIRSHLQMASFSFDVFVGDLVRAFCSGARLVLCPREALLAPSQLVQILTEYEIDCTEFVPAVVRLLLDHLRESGRKLPQLRLAIVGSDTWTAAEYEQLRAVMEPGARVINSYGVAEATIDSSYYEKSTAAANGGDDQLPVGRPFASCELLVLDRYLQPLPIGVPGELYLGGAGLARGYFGRPAQTAERFVPHPFARSPGERLYRTGDRARWLTDGNLEFLGRADNQIKIRGFRIEPGEIEARLAEHPAVRRAVVVPHGERQKQLVAYVVADTPGGDLPAKLRGWLRERLPEYMVPAAFVVLDKLPLSPNGKVDRRALPAPSMCPAGPPRVPPQTDAQRRVAAIWAQVLGLPEVGLADNFFDLGGHSLLLFELHTKLRGEFGQEIPLVELFRLPTVEDQARRLAPAASETLSPSAEAAPHDAIRRRIEKQRQSLHKQQSIQQRRAPRTPSPPRGSDRS
jgi:amino acid adenylation domain-containing protein